MPHKPEMNDRIAFADDPGCTALITMEPVPLTEAEAREVGVNMPAWRLEVDEIENDATMQWVAGEDELVLIEKAEPE